MTTPLIDTPSLDIHGVQITLPGLPVQARSVIFGFDMDGDQFNLQGNDFAQNTDGTVNLAVSCGDPSFFLRAAKGDPDTGVAYAAVQQGLMGMFGPIVQSCAAGPYPEQYFRAWCIFLGFSVAAQAANPTAPDLLSCVNSGLDVLEARVLAGNPNGAEFQIAARYAAQFAITHWGVPSPFASRLLAAENHFATLQAQATAAAATLAADQAALAGAQAALAAIAEDQGPAAAQAAVDAATAALAAATSANIAAQAALAPAQAIVAERTAQAAI